MPKNINFLFLGSIAAVILAGAISILYFLNRDTELDQLFAKYFEVYQGIPETANSQSIKNSFAEALKAYQAGDYKKSLNTLKAITSSDTAKAEHFFFLGNTLLALDNPRAGEAMKAFREVFKMNHVYIEQAQWYFGLACLKNHDENAARTIFWEIARKGSGFKQREARKIVDKLLEER